MPRFHVEAYNLKGERILGNGCGQGFIDAKDYRRTKRFKELVSEPAERFDSKGTLHKFRILDERGKVLCSIVKR